MELAMHRKQGISKKWILFPLLILCLVMLIPSAIVFASALDDPTIGMNGVNDSDLTIGMTGVNHSDLLIERGNNGHVNPSAMYFPLMMIVPLVFFALAILLILGMVFTDGLNIKGLILVAILIIIALALLAGVNFRTNSLLGG